VVTIAITGIALGIMAMLLSVMVVTGFRNEISDKVTGFMAHLRIHKFDANNSFEDSPISNNQPYLEKLRQTLGIKKVQAFANKACILKAKDEIQGVVLKGVDQNFDWSFFKNKIIEGSVPKLGPETSSEVVISKNLAQKLQLKLGDSFLVFFIRKDRKVRKLKITGIYNTGLSEEFDNIYLLCDLRLIRQVNNWKPDEVGGFEVILNNFNELDKIAPVVYSTVGYQLNVQTIKEINPQIFNWLELQNLNVWVIIALITLVAGITMISTLLIIVLENSRHIGLLKAMGASDQLVSKTFRYISLKILFKGLVIGNIAGMGLAFLQNKFGFITLAEESYYLTKVPVNFSLSGWLLINTATIVICLSMMLIPSRIISKIKPIRVLRFD
jgi:lipoprotein-releasing system permease protein